MRQTTLVFSSLLSLVLAPAAGAEQLVVLNSTAAGLESGVLLEGSEPLSLEDGAAVTLVTQSGRIIELKGPWNGAPAAGAGVDSGEPKLLDAVKQLVSGGGESTAPGAFRGAGDSEDPPIANLIAASRTGHYCVAAGGLPTLWRGDPAEEAELRLRQSGGGGRAVVFFEEDQATASWPQDLPLEDGATYASRWSDSNVSRQLTIHQMPTDLPDDAHRLVWMLQRDCLLQAGALLGTAYGGQQ